MTTWKRAPFPWRRAPLQSHGLATPSLPSPFLRQRRLGHRFASTAEPGLVGSDEQRERGDFGARNRRVEPGKWCAHQSFRRSPRLCGERIGKDVIAGMPAAKKSPT